jgi:YD repeat-containing protein
MGNGTKNSWAVSNGEGRKMIRSHKSRLRTFVWLSGAVLLFPFVARAQTPIDCGQTLSASISAAGERNSYTFTASANDGIIILTRKTSGTLAPYLELYGPSGTLVASAANQIDRILTAPGTYRIDVRDQNNTNTGDYLLYWQRMNNPSGATPINCGEAVTGSIGTSVDPPPWKVYTFTASAGDAVTIRSLKTSGTSFVSYMELYGPNGTYIDGFYNYPLNRVLTATGTHSILIRDYYKANAGDFFLTYQVMSNPCNAIAINSGQAVSGSISSPRDMNVYTFTAATNDGVAIRVRKTSGDFTPNIEIFGPTGTYLGGPYTNQINRILGTAGMYKIIVRDSSYANTGDYLLYWERMNNPSNATSISCGHVLAGAIGTSVDPPPWKAYTFMGSSGDVVSIRSLKIPGTSFVSYMELYGPNGSFMGADYNGPLEKTLTATGTHTILIRDYYNAYAGDFLLTWERINSPCAPELGCGQTVAGVIGRTVSEPFWGLHKISVSANDIVKILVIKTSGKLVPYIDLYGPRYIVASFGGEFTRTLTIPGTYTIVVRDQTNSYTGSYALTWQRWNNPSAQAIGCGQVISGSIGLTADPPPWKYYSFTASANDSVSLRMTKTSGKFTPYLELYGPTGTQAGSGTGQLDKTLTTAGTYTIEVKDQKSINTGEFFLTLHRINNPCGATIGCGQKLMGSLGVTGKIDAYTFTASGGDNIVLTLTRTTGGLDPSLELYSSSGARLASQYTTSGDQVSMNQTLSSGGTYTVLVSDYGNDETGNYRLKLQKNNNICPEVTVMTPNGEERIVVRSHFPIRWSSSSSVGIDSQEIRFSTDGGQTFASVIVTGLLGSVRSYDWAVPQEKVTTQGRVRLIATDISGRSTSDDSDADFEIYQGVGRTYVYDELNRLHQVIYEDGRSVTYTYDATGNRLSLTNELENVFPLSLQSFPWPPKSRGGNTSLFRGDQPRSGTGGEENLIAATL